MTEENAAPIEGQGIPTEGQATETPTAGNQNLGELFSKPEEKLYAGKYKSVEELEKAYGEVNKLASKKVEAVKTDAPAAMDTNGAYSRIEQQALTGQFDEQTLELITHLGMTPERAMSIAQQEQSSNRAALSEGIGRDVDFDAWNQWWPTNVSEAEQEVAQKSMKLGDYSFIDKLMAKMEAATPEAADAPVVGKSPSLSTGNPTDRSPYRTQAEIGAAVKEAAKDPAKWAVIESRLNHTPDSVKNG